MSRSSRTGPGPVERTLHFDSQRIAYRLHQGKRRSLRITVTPDLVVNVFAPARASDEWVEEVLRRRAGWIVRTLENVASCETLTIPENVVGEEPVRFIGKEYRVALIEGQVKPPHLFFDRLVLTAPNCRAPSAAGRILKQWYRDRAEEVFARSIDRCLPCLEPYGVTRPTVTIRNMRSRWGSCSSTGRVSLNLKLVMVAERLIDYVVMHELCHIVRHDHSKRFYALLATCMPDWKQRKKDLERYRMM